MSHEAAHRIDRSRRRPSQRAGRKDPRLAAAHRARNRGRERTAIALYRQILIEDPHNTDVALRLAPILARRGHGFEAWWIYRTAALDFAREKQWAECLSVYRDACRFVPREFEAWRLCAELQFKLGREEDAFETLLEGRSYFCDPGSRAQAIALLTRARVIEPWQPELALDLAGLYARTEQTDAALELLACLARRESGRTLRRVRALQWRITLSPRFALLWFRALGEADGDHGEGAPAEVHRLRTARARADSLRH